MIHDIGEAKTGDKISWIKGDEDRRVEAEAFKFFMEILFPNLQERETLTTLWSGMDSNNADEAGNINSRVAKDIDRIQAVYQFCFYVSEGKVALSEEDWRRWKADLESISTSVGKDMVENVILRNPKFLFSENAVLAKLISSFKFS